MAAPEKWWVVGAAAPRQPVRWNIVAAASKPPGDFVYGPYPTRAAAEARFDSVASPIKPPTLPTPPNPFAGLSGIGKIGHWLGDIVLHVTDTAMWRSIGWLLLGALLVFAGVYLWFRTSATYKDLEGAVLGTAKAL